MEHFEDLPIQRAPLSDDPAPPPTRTRTGPVLVIAVIGVILGAATAWWWTRSPRTPVAPPAAVQSTEAVVSPPASRPALPPLGQMDTFLRALLGTLSAHPDWARWLATDELIRQMANGIDHLSRGQTPAREFPTFRPAGDFTVRRARGAVLLDPASFARYDRITALVESLDARAVVNVYQTIQPRLDEAYRALGRSEGNVDTAIAAAIHTLLATPIPNEPVALVPGKGPTFAYAAAEFEQLKPSQKQLLRTGPNNARRIQSKLREINALSGWR